ncbi:MAG: InlB B-repeat-containing protein [Clostridia bacterium]
MVNIKKSIPIRYIALIIVSIIIVTMCCYVLCPLSVDAALPPKKKDYYYDINNVLFATRLHGEPAPDAPIISGYKFVEWIGSRNDNFDYVYTPVYALGNKHTVTFYNYDGTVLATVDVEDGQIVTPPTAPAVDGKVFLGWKPRQ